MAWQNILEGDAWHSPSFSHHRPAKLRAQAGTSQTRDPCRKLEASQSTGRMIFALRLGQWHGGGRRKHIPVAEETAESREPPGRWGWKGKGTRGCPADQRFSGVFPSGSPLQSACSTLSSLQGGTEREVPTLTGAPKRNWTHGSPSMVMGGGEG